MNTFDLEWVKAFHTPAAPAQPDRCVCGSLLPCYVLEMAGRIQELGKENSALREQLAMAKMVAQMFAPEFDIDVLAQGLRERVEGMCRAFLDALEGKK